MTVRIVRRFLTAVTAVALCSGVVAGPAGADSLADCRFREKYRPNLVQVDANCPSGRITASSSNLYDNDTQVDGRSFGKRFGVALTRNGDRLRFRGYYGKKTVRGHRDRSRAGTGKRPEFNYRVAATFGGKKLRCRTSALLTSPSLDGYVWGALRVNGRTNPSSFGEAWKRCVLALTVAEGFAFNMV